MRGDAAKGSTRWLGPCLLGPCLLGVGLGALGCAEATTPGGTQQGDGASGGAGGGAADARADDAAGGAGGSAGGGSGGAGGVGGSAGAGGGAADLGPLDGALRDAGPGADGGSGVPCVETVQVAGVEIFKYEASRPDATAASAGVGAPADGICSRAGAQPWVELTVAEAQVACASAGFRLCTEDEWAAACSGGPERGWPYPYGTRHTPGLCNDHISGAGATEVTGTRPDCATPEGVVEQSGNVWEFVVTADGSGLRRGASYQLNAGAFRAENAGCTESFFVIPSYAAQDTGFRCCR